MSEPLEWRLTLKNEGADKKGTRSSGQCRSSCCVSTETDFVLVSSCTNMNALRFLFYRMISIKQSTLRTQATRIYIVFPKEWTTTSYVPATNY